MKKRDRIPGDILKTIRKVDQQVLMVFIKGKLHNINRKQYDSLMKSTLFFFNPSPNTPEGDAPVSGFYLVDPKTKTCKLVIPLELKPSDVVIKVNDLDFKVCIPWRGFTYAQ